MPKKQTTSNTESQTELSVEENQEVSVTVSQESTDTPSNDDSRVVGCVKWFDHQKGYGFVTQISEGEHKNEDIFVHQSNVNTKEDTYRILYDGETVTFDIQVTDGEKHPYQAIDVTGYQDIPLQCENKAIHRSVRRTNANTNANGNNNYNNNANNNTNNNGGGGNRYNGNSSGNGGGRSTYSNKRGTSGNRQRNNDPVEEI
jgi:cold shock protein